MASRRKKVIEKLTKDEIIEEFKELKKSIIEKLKSLKNKTIAIITHNNPDPDAVSSSFALKKFLCALGHKKENIQIFADGNLTREAKVIKEKLGGEILPLGKFNKKKHKTVILIDVSSINQGNLKLKNGNQPDLVIDHHSDEDPFGATATIIAFLMTIFDIEIDEDMATALTVGIKTDTNDLVSKKVSKFDILAYRKILSPLVNDQLLKEIVKCGYSASYRKILVNALEKYRYQEGSTVISGVGYIKPNQLTDLAKIANFILEEEGVEKVIVISIVEHERRDKEGNIVKYEKYIIPTARASTPTENIGDLNKKVFGEKAGGDSDKASGEVPLTNDEIKKIERAKKDHNYKLLEGYFLDILYRYQEKILEEETK